jgi:hypothetical protein
MFQGILISRQYIAELYWRYLMSATSTTKLEKESLEAHVDLCAIRYQNLDSRLTIVEQKIDSIHIDIKEGQNSLVKVLIGTAGTIVAGLLSTIVVLLMNT